MGYNKKQVAWNGLIWGEEAFAKIRKWRYWNSHSETDRVSHSGEGLGRSISLPKNFALFMQILPLWPKSTINQSTPNEKPWIEDHFIAFIFNFKHKAIALMSLLMALKIISETLLEHLQKTMTEFFSENNYLFLPTHHLCKKPSL